jgi:hypothetical protein
MKLYIAFRHFLLLFFIFYSTLTLGQTPIDSVISIKFPGKVEAFKKANAEASLKGLYFNSEKESYVVFRTTLLKNGGELAILPADAAGLTDIYHHDIANLIAPMRKKGFVFKDSTKINIEGYTAYKLKYVDLKSDSQSAESILLFLNGVRYAITYSKVTTYSEKNKEDFLNSLKIAHSNSLKQIAKPDDNSSVLNFILTAVITLGLVIFFIRASKNKSQFGMNFKRVYCPVCNTKQPIIRMPGSINQALVGGTTCAKCHENLDKYGNVIR